MFGCRNYQRWQPFWVFEDERRPLRDRKGAVTVCNGHAVLDNQTRVPAGARRRETDSHPVQLVCRYAVGAESGGGDEVGALLPVGMPEALWDPVATDSGAFSQICLVEFGTTSRGGGAAAHRCG